MTLHLLQGCKESVTGKIAFGSIVVHEGQPSSLVSAKIPRQNCRKVRNLRVFSLHSEPEMASYCAFHGPASAIFFSVGHFGSSE
jgi:hypothetical protein